MSGTVSRGQPGGRGQAGSVSQAGVPLEAPGSGRRRQSRRVAAGLVVAVVAAAAVVAWLAGVFRSPGAAGPGRGAASVPTAAVTREDLSAVTPVSGTLGYSGSFTVSGHGGGTLTQLPPVGKVIRQGQVLWRVDNGSPVVLLYGRVPAWRALEEGLTGGDVRQLNHDLVRLGYAKRANIRALGWDYFSWRTMVAVEDLQAALRISDPSGVLSPGSVAFEPAAIRLTAVRGMLGGPAAGQVLAASSDKRVVNVALDAGMQSQVKAGDKVTVTLPDGNTTPGVVSQVGTVATSSSGGSGSPGSTATIPVQVNLTHPHAADRLDQAPVTVNITTGSVHDVLAVPVGALLARPGGGYAVEEVTVAGRHHLVAVHVGLFDDTSGLVQVSGAGLAAGQRVVASQ